MIKKTLIFLLFAAISMAIGYYVFDDPKPEGKASGAELLTDQLFEAINIEAWHRIPIVAWTSTGSHHYIWHKHNHVSQLKWDKYEVVINLDNQRGEAFQDGLPLTGKDAEEALAKAWALWCNDAFWLSAPAKVRDAGTERSVVVDAEGNPGLFVEYVSGGVTPGDAYLWTFSETGLPESFKMWVSILPIGGVEASWENWVDLDGAMISTLRKVGPVPIRIEHLRSGQSPKDFGLEPDYFSRWVEN